jgi:hypothetical protein
MYNPFRPRILEIFPKVKGADKAKAQGQATIRIEINTLGIIEGSIKYQIILETVAREISMIKKK